MINEHSCNIADLYFMLSAIHYFVLYFVSVNTILYFVRIGETVDCSNAYAIYKVVYNRSNNTSFATQTLKQASKDGVKIK